MLVQKTRSWEFICLELKSPTKAFLRRLFLRFFHAFCGVKKRGADVFLFEGRILLEDFFFRQAVAKKREDKINWNSSSLNDWLSTHDFRICDDAVNDLFHATHPQPSNQTFGSQIFFISSGERNFGVPVLRGLRAITLRNSSKNSASFFACFSEIMRYPFGVFLRIATLPYFLAYFGWKANPSPRIYPQSKFVHTYPNNAMGPTTH